MRVALSREDTVSLLGRLTARRERTLVAGVARAASTLRPLAVPASQDLLGSAALLRNVLELVMRELGARYRRPALLFSGGLDSTILAVLAQRAGMRFDCIVVDADDVGGAKESSIAARVARELGLDVVIATTRAGNLNDLCERSAATRDRPTTCWAAVNTRAAAELAAQRGCDVLLSGLGSDEAFGGYHKIGRYGWRFRGYADRYGARCAWNALTGAPSRARTQLMYVGQACPFPRALLARLFPGCDVGAVLEDDLVTVYASSPAFGRSNDVTGAMLAVELALRTPEALLADFDHAAGQAGLRTRYPFLDERVLGLAASIGIEHKYCYGSPPELRWRPPTRAIDKLVLRCAFQDVVPECAQTRVRRTFSVPIAAWLGAPGERDRVRAAVAASPVWDAVGANRRVLAHVLDSPLGGNPWAAPFRLWLLHQFVLWCERGGPQRIAEAAA